MFYFTLPIANITIADIIDSFFFPLGKDLAQWHKRLVGKHKILSFLVPKKKKRFSPVSSSLS